MYLARFEGDDGGWVAAAVRRASPRRAADLGTLLTTGLEVPEASFALRTQLTVGVLEQVLLLNGPAASEEALSSFLEELGSRSALGVELCASKARHDEIAAGFPAARQGRMRPGGYRAGEHRLATDFRLFAVMDSLFVAALAHPWTVAYQVNVLRFQPSVDDLRWLRKQLVRIELDSRVPAGVLGLQSSIVERFPETTYLIEELVGCGETASWEYLRKLVDDEFAVQMNRYRFTVSPLEAGDPSALADSVETGFHSEMLEETDAVVRAAAAARTAEIARILRWDPPLASTVRRPAGLSPDVFISYSSRNREVAEVVCDALEQDGIGCWIAPRDIAPGIPYPEAIMRGLTGCRALVLIFSAHANASPHVQREVERAVSKQVPVLTLRLDATPLAAGMEYLVGLSQWLDAADPPHEEDLRRLGDGIRALRAAPGA